MNLEACQNEFAVRVYRWALAEWEKQIEEDLALLRLVKEPNAVALVGFLERLPRSEQMDVAVALLKWFHAKAVATLGDQMTPREEELRRRCADHVLNSINPLVVTGITQAPVNRKQLKANLKSRLTPICGPISTDFGGPSEWRHETRVHAWAVHTYMDVGGRSHQIAYDHVIAWAPPRVVLREGISYPRWLSAGTSQWSLVGAGDEAAAAEAVATLCGRIIGALPELLEALEVTG